MLKIERTGSSGFTIRLRERESFFEHRLVIALAIAIALHAAALLLFHVTPFFLSSTFTFPPITVASHISERSVSTIAASIESDSEALPPPILLIPALDRTVFSQESALLPSAFLDMHALKALEEQSWPRWYEPLSLTFEEPLIQLTLAGDLAEVPLMSSDPLLNEMHPVSFDEAPSYLSYNVRLNVKTGEIYWYERVYEAGGERAITQIAEKILRSLKFEPSDRRGIDRGDVQGTLHFVIYEGAALPLRHKI